MKSNKKYIYPHREDAVRIILYDCHVIAYVFSLVNQTFHLSPPGGGKGSGQHSTYVLSLWNAQIKNWWVGSICGYLAQQVNNLIPACWILAGGTEPELKSANFPSSDLIDLGAGTKLMWSVDQTLSLPLGGERWKSGSRWRLIACYLNHV